MLEKPAYSEPAPESVPPAGTPGPAVEKANDIDAPRVTIPSKKEGKSKPSHETNTVIGSDVVFNGELVARSNIHIHGTFEGTIARDTNNVIVGEQGRVKALVHARSVRIQGQVDGDIYGDEIVELMSGSRVNGNIFCTCVRIEKGAIFNGTVTMI